MRKNVAVIFGGISCENEISVITGTMAANLIDPEKYAVHPVYIAQNGEMYTGEQLRDTAFFRGGLSDKKCPRALLSDGKLYAVRGRKLKEVCAIDCALNCCHGMNGEDGAVAGLLRLNRIPDASPDMAASAVFMDKGMTKLIAKALNIPAPAFFRISEAEYKKRGAMAIKCIEERLGYPVIVKPARLGSSIGVAVAEDRAKLAFAIEAGFAYDTVLIAEKYLSDRREINCAAYRAGDEIVVSACEEPKTDNKFLTFGDKYMGEGETARGRLSRQNFQRERRAHPRLYKTLIPAHEHARRGAGGFSHERGRGVLQRDEHRARLARVVPVLRQTRRFPRRAHCAHRAGHPRFSGAGGKKTLEQLRGSERFPSVVGQAAQGIGQNRGKYAAAGANDCHFCAFLVQ